MSFALFFPDDRGSCQAFGEVLKVELQVLDSEGGWAFVAHEDTSSGRSNRQLHPEEVPSEEGCCVEGKEEVPSFTDESSPHHPPLLQEADESLIQREFNDVLEDEGSMDGFESMGASAIQSSGPAALQAFFAGTEEADISSPYFPFQERRHILVAHPSGDGDYDGGVADSDATSANSSSLFPAVVTDSITDWTGDGANIRDERVHDSQRAHLVSVESPTARRQAARAEELRLLRGMGFDDLTVLLPLLGENVDVQAEHVDTQGLQRVIGALLSIPDL
jgi:hypothetical protein